MRPCLGASHAEPENLPALQTSIKNAKGKKVCDQQYKQCSKCHQLKPVGECVVGRAQCKKCIAAYLAAYRATHRDERRAYKAAYYATHRDEILAYCATHRDKKRAYDAAYDANKLVNKSTKYFFQTLTLGSKLNQNAKSNEK